MSSGIVIGINGMEELKRTVREFKGKSLIDFPLNFTVIDIETTGLDTRWDEIIEVSAIKIRDGFIHSSFSETIQIENELDEFIIELTGITDEMLQKSRTVTEVLPDYLKFIGDDILIGHNVNFDINFIYDNYLLCSNKPFTNDFVDTLRLSRRLLPDLKHHRLDDLIQYFNLEKRELHRGLSDCEYTLKIFTELRNMISDIDEFILSCKKKNKYILDARDIHTTNTEFDVTHPLYKKNCVFTGKLEKMIRKDAMQIVVDFGCICQNGVTATTNYLILGNNDYCSTIKDGKSSKQKKAEKLKLEGKDIEIISENTFYDMIIDNI